MSNQRWRRCSSAAAVLLHSAQNVLQPMIKTVETPCGRTDRSAAERREKSCSMFDFKRFVLMLMEHLSVCLCYGCSEEGPEHRGGGNTERVLIQLKTENQARRQKGRKGREEVMRGTRRSLGGRHRWSSSDN